MQIVINSKRGMIYVGIAFVAVIFAFFALKYKYTHSIEKHCVYISRQVSDLGPPERVCPRVCERQKMEYDTSFSYQEKKVGTQCACCSTDAFKGNLSTPQTLIP